MKRTFCDTTVGMTETITHCPSARARRNSGARTGFRGSGEILRLLRLKFHPLTMRMERIQARRNRRNYSFASRGARCVWTDLRVSHAELAYGGPSGLASPGRD